MSAGESEPHSVHIRFGCGKYSCRAGGRLKPQPICLQSQVDSFDFLARGQ